MKNIKRITLICALLIAGIGAQAWDYWYTADSFYDDGAWLADNSSDEPAYGEFDPNSKWLDDIEVTPDKDYDWGLDDDWWRTYTDEDNTDDSDQTEFDFYKWDDEEGKGSIYIAENFYTYKNVKKEGDVTTLSEKLSTNNAEAIEKFLKSISADFYLMWKGYKSVYPQLDWMGFTYAVDNGNGNISSYITQQMTLSDCEGNNITFSIETSFNNNDLRMILQQEAGGGFYYNDLIFKFEMIGDDLRGYVIDNWGNQLDFYVTKPEITDPEPYIGEKDGQRYAEWEYEGRMHILDNSGNTYSIPLNFTYGVCTSPSQEEKDKK